MSQLIKQIELRNGSCVDLIVNFTVTECSYTPSHTSGLPEDCYPEESEFDYIVDSYFINYYMECSNGERSLEVISESAMEYLMDQYDESDLMEAYEEECKDNY